jgi:glycogen operon protein
MLEFTRQLVQFRREHHSFRRRRFFQGRQLRGSATEDLGWFSPTGDEMSEEQWSEAYAHAITLFMSGREIERDARGETVTDDDFLWMVNASPDDIKFTLPPERWGADWYVAIDTAAAQVSPADPTVLIAGSSFDVPGRSFVLLRRQRPDATG